MDSSSSQLLDAIATSSITNVFSIKKIVPSIDGDTAVMRWGRSQKLSTFQLFHFDGDIGNSTISLVPISTQASQPHLRSLVGDVPIAYKDIDARVKSIYFKEMHFMKK